MYLTQPLKRNAQIFSNKTATQFGERQHTWSEVMDRVARLAGALQSQGLKKNDKVAILALNSDRYLETIFATPWAGGVIVPLNIRWSAQENIYSLEDSNSAILIVDDAFSEAAQQILQQSNIIKTVIYAGEGETPAGMLNYETLLQDSKPVEDACNGYDDLAGIFYTGGTTGFPKGVMLSHQNIWTSSFSGMVELKFNIPDTIFLHAAPIFHISGFSMLMGNTIAGATHAFIPAFDPKRVVEAIEQYGVTDTVLVPTMINMMLASPALEQADISTLRKIIYGASPMQEGTLTQIMEKLPNVDFYNAYGQTEMAPAISCLGPEYHVLEGPNAGRLKSAGRPFHCVEIKIIDANGETLPAGQVGEIAVRGPNAMQGYWNKAEQTSSTLIDNWLMTGDAGYLDTEGFLFLVDRVKDMIISGGENVFSAEVENSLSKHPAVLEAVVIGIPNDKWGESVHAIVRLKPDHTASEQEIIDFCHKYIAGYKCPRSVEFREEPFPMTGAGKLRKVDLRKSYWKEQGLAIN